MFIELKSTLFVGCFFIILSFPGDPLTDHFFKERFMFRSSKRQNLLQIICRPVFLQSLLLGLAAAAVYGQFLWSPVVFDDIYFFDGTIHANYLERIFSFDLRWMPYATFEWTKALLGLDLIWFHLGNLALHIANISALFLFLRRFFGVVLPSDMATSPAAAKPLSHSWLAFFGALIFALHPAAVYAVAYLSQRSILMATFFTLIMWRLFIEGITRESRWWLTASAGAYFFAVLSKEHAIMVPAVAFALLFLLRQPSRQLFRQVWPVFALYILIGTYVAFQVKSRHILGQAYEINSVDMLARLASQDTGFDRSLAYPLSVLTQFFLFFKYLLVWILPSPAWMSVDMYEDFANRLWVWPQILGLIGFVLYFIVAVRLLLQRGMKGLFGFALLCPWLLFATEFSTIRIQESFVLYRSYLWMIGFFAAIPFLVQKLPAKRAAVILMAITFVMVPLTWFRLTTFSHPLLLWDDAARLVENKDDRPGVERIYHNRGIMLSRLKMYPQAIEDYSKAITIYPEYSYAYNDRGAAYLETKKYSQALNDFTKAIELNPKYYRPYLGRAKVYETLKNHESAHRDYQKICLMGIELGCQKIKNTF